MSKNVKRRKEFKKRIHFKLDMEEWTIPFAICVVYFSGFNKLYTISFNVLCLRIIYNCNPKHFYY